MNLNFQFDDFHFDTRTSDSHFTVSDAEMWISIAPFVKSNSYSKQM